MKFKINLFSSPYHGRFNKNLCAYVCVCVPSNGKFQKSPADSNIRPGLKSLAGKLHEGVFLFLFCSLVCLRVPKQLPVSQ